MIIDDLEDLPDSFKEGVRGVMLIHRNKDGHIGNAQRTCIKKISKNKEEWTEAVQYFERLQRLAFPLHRIYSCVNSRDMAKAIHEFKVRQLYHDYGNSEELERFYQDIQNRFFSCLMNPNCRKESNFLIDCDSEEEYECALKTLPKELIVYQYPTRNGHHIISKPFNPNEYQIEIKKDDLIYIG